MERDFKGIWIPKELWLTDELTTQEKLFFLEIDSLNNEDGCYATNEHFSKFFKLSKNRCSEVIKSLEKKGYISLDYSLKKGTKSIEKRVIKGIRKIDRPIRDVDWGYSEKLEENNTVFNNTKYIVELVNFLNKTAGKNYNHKTDNTRKIINARFRDGYTLEDMKKVVEKKCDEWIGTEWENYLRPSTLFSAKNFDNYLNQKKIQKRKREGVVF